MQKSTFRTLALGLCMAMLQTPLTAQQEAPAYDSFKDLKMRSIGPAFMSGRIADIALHPADHSIWYVAVGSGGVWKTVNNGTTWKPLFDEQSAYSIGCVTLDPSNPDVVWVGTGENVGGRHVGYGDGLYRSSDGGQSWEHRGLKKSEHISKIIVHPDDPNRVYVAAQGPLWSAGGQRGFYRTTDGGKTWTRTLGDEQWTGVTDILMDPRNPDRLYAATWQRHRSIAAYLGGGPKTALYRSEDGGKSWTELKKGLPEAHMGKIGLALSPQDPDVVYAAIELHHREGAVYRSTDRGASWEKRSETVSGATGPHYYQELYASPHQKGRLYLMDVRAQISEDGGKTFRRMNETFKHSDNHAMAFRPGDPNYLLFGTDGGLYESHDGGKNWRYIDNLPVTQFYKLALDDSRPFYNIYGGTQDNNTQMGPSRTDNYHGIQNSDWEVVLFADGHEPATEPGNPNIAYAQWQQGNLTRLNRRTGEVTYIRPQPEEGAEPERYNWDAPILVSRHDSQRLYHGSQRLWRSNNRGDSWQALSGDLTRDEERIEMPIMGKQQSWDNAWDFYAMSTYGTITSIAESSQKENLLMVGTDDGLLQVTRNGGKDWRRIPLSELPGAPARAYVNHLAPDRYDGETFYLALDNHKFGDFRPLLYKTTDAGQSWENLAKNLPDRHLVWRIIQDPKEEELLYIGTEFGVFFSLNGGEDWSKMAGGIPNIAVRDLALQEREDDLVAATFGRGFYLLDHLEPLRHLTRLRAEEEAALLPPRDARWYIPRAQLSFGSKKGAQGASHFVADNPPHGATFTYYLPKDHPSRAQKRKEKEKPLAKAGEDIPFPGWEQLADEMQELGTRHRLHIYDAEKRLVRRLAVCGDSGLHRVTWDMRHPSLRALSRDAEEGKGSGLLAAPGRYTAQLYRVDSGQVKALGVPQSFALQPLYEDKEVNPRPQQRKAFWRSYETLVRDFTALDKRLAQVEQKAQALRLAYQASPGTDSAVAASLFGLKKELDELIRQQKGNPAKRKIGEKTRPTLQARLGKLGVMLRYNTHGPTQTALSTRDLIQGQLKPLETQVAQLEKKSQALAEAIKALGGPAVED